MTDAETMRFFGALLGGLGAFTVFGLALQRAAKAEGTVALARIVTARVRIWWAMCIVFAVAMLTGGVGSIVVFGCTSFLLLRESVTIAPTHRGDHRTLFYVFFVITPLHYYFLAVDWYGMFIILIPVYAFLFIPTRMVLSGDAERFLERVAKIQLSLMLCVYCVSHAPALLKLDLPGGRGVGARLLLFLVIVVQIGDLVRQVADRALGKHRMLPTVSDDLTWEGFGLSSACAVGAGTVLWWATPFTWFQAFILSLFICLLGSAGVLCLAAVRRDRNRKGVVVVQTRASMIERVISLCFAAPLFFHLIRFYFGGGAPQGFGPF